MRNFLLSAVMGASVLASIAFAQPAQAVIIYSNNFDTAVACSFTCTLNGGTTLTSPGTSAAVPTAAASTNFLGNLGQGASATLTLSGLSAHSTVTVAFLLDVVGSMDGTGNNGGGNGDFFTVSYTGSGSGTVFNQNFANYGGGNVQSYMGPNAAPTTGAATINALGYTGFPDSGNGVQDSEYNFSGLSALTFADTGSTLSITFTGLSNEALNNEFYGIDNLRVQITGAGVVTPPGTGTGNVPEPAPVLLMGIGLAAFMVEKRRRR